MLRLFVEALVRLYESLTGAAERRRISGLIDENRFNYKAGMATLDRERFQHAGDQKWKEARAAQRRQTKKPAPPPASTVRAFTVRRGAGGSKER